MHAVSDHCGALVPSTDVGWQRYGSHGLYAKVSTGACSKQPSSQIIFDLLRSLSDSNMEEEAHIFARTPDSFTLIVLSKRVSSAMMVSHASRAIAVSWITKSGHQTGATVAGKTAWKQSPEPDKHSLVL